MDFWLLIWRPVDWGSARKTGIEMIGEKSSLVTVLLYFLRSPFFALPLDVWKKLANG